MIPYLAHWLMSARVLRTLWTPLEWKNQASGSGGNRFDVVPVWTNDESCIVVRVVAGAGRADHRLRDPLSALRDRKLRLAGDPRP